MESEEQDPSRHKADVVCKRRVSLWLRALGSEVQSNLTHHESPLLNCFLGKNNYRESENKKPKLLMFLFIFPMRLIWVLRILRLVQCCNNFLCQATTSAPLERSALWVSAWERNIDLAPECHGWPTSSDSQKKTCGSLKAKGVFNFEAELIRMIRTATRHDGIQPAHSAR